MHLRVKYPNGGWWFFTPIYASPIEERRRLLWDDLTALAQHITNPWMLAWDFNDIMILCVAGPKFTWRGPIFHGGQRIFERLDRALCNDQWRLEFPNGSVKVLTRLEFFDHHPILISPTEAPHPMAPKQFKFESAWLLDDTYNKMLKQCWKGDIDMVHNLHIVERDLK
ncbi:hypothetical protein A2U01_0033890, partial [Trifolium medium]|nr:hypothetical protein [Trifolium medium]